VQETATKIINDIIIGFIFFDFRSFAFAQDDNLKCKINTEKV
jgi:hypothetical protein